MCLYLRIIKLIRSSLSKLFLYSLIFIIRLHVVLYRCQRNFHERYRGVALSVTNTGVFLFNTVMMFLPYVFITEVSSMFLLIYGYYRFALFSQSY